jgi:hypothetical protein
VAGVQGSGFRREAVAAVWPLLARFIRAGEGLMNPFDFPPRLELFQIYFLPASLRRDFERLALMLAPPAYVVLPAQTLTAACG